METSRQRDRTADHCRDLEVGQRYMVEHPIKFPERDQSKHADQEPKQNFISRKCDGQRDGPENDRADEPENENRTRGRGFRRRWLKRHGHDCSSSRRLARRARPVLSEAEWIDMCEMRA